MDSLRKQPLTSSTYIKPKPKDYFKACASLGIPKPVAKAEYNRDPEACFSNERYIVLVYKTEPHGFGEQEIWHLSIRRRDREPIHDWRVLQEIKNQVCGADKEGVELYPKESRVVDCANQFHLYVFMTAKIIPIGFAEGMKVNKPFLNSKQRPFK